MRKKKYLLLSFFLIGLLAKGAEKFESEIGLYSINLNNKMKIATTKVHITPDEKIYLELQSFLRMVGMTNYRWVDNEFIIDEANVYKQEKTINLGSGKIESDNGDIRYESHEIIEDGDKIYVAVESLPKLLSISELGINDDRLEILINADFRLPYELGKIRESRREEFENKEEQNIESIRPRTKFFEPGNLRLMYNYSKSFQTSDAEMKTVDGEYMGQVFYGDLETYYKIYPEVDNVRTTLRYRDAYKGHTISFGDVNTSMPTALRGTVGSLRGISFAKEHSLISEYGEDSVTIKGNAPLGKFVELYRNGKLVSYVDVINGQYIFEDIDLLFYSDSFYVIIHNADGTAKRENLKRYSSVDLEKKGEFGFAFYSGESSYDRYDQVIGEVNYGLTDRLTLKTGFYDLKYNAYYADDNPQSETILKLGAIYASDYGIAPFNADVEIFKSNKSDSIDATYRYNQIYEDYRLSLSGGTYAEASRLRLNKKNEFNASIDKSRLFGQNLSVGVKYYSSDSIRDEKTRELGVVTRTGTNNLTLEYGVYKDLEYGRILHDVGVRSYHFNDISLFAGVKHERYKGYDDTIYRAEIMNRYSNHNDIRMKLFYEKSEKMGESYGFSFDIDYSNWFSASANYTRSNEVSHSGVGYSIDKVINIDNPNEKISSVENGIVTGRTYVDLNEDGKYTEGIDKPLPRTAVSVGGREGTSDENGLYKVFDVNSKSKQKVKFETQNPMYVGKYDGYEMRPIQASSSVIDIPLYLRKLVSGVIDFATEELRHKYLTTLYLNIYDVNTGDLKEVVIPENDGFITVDNLISGKYRFVLESVNKPGIALAETEITLDKEVKEVNLDLSIEGEVSNEEDKLAVAFAVAYNN